MQKMEIDEVFPPYEIPRISYEKLSELSKFLMFFFLRKNKVFLFENLPFPTYKRQVWETKIHPIIKMWIVKPHIYSYLINNLLEPLKRYSFIKFILDPENNELYNRLPFQQFNYYAVIRLQQIFRYNLEINPYFNDYLLKKYIFIIKCFILHKIKKLQTGLPIKIYKNVLRLNPYLSGFFGENLEKIPINDFLLPYQLTDKIFTKQDEEKILNIFNLVNVSLQYQDIISNQLFVFKQDFLPRLDPNVKEFIPLVIEENIPENLHEIGLSSAEFVLDGE